MYKNANTLTPKISGHLYFGHFNFGQKWSAISLKLLMLSRRYALLKIVLHMRGRFLASFAYHQAHGMSYKPLKFRTRACPKFKLSDIFGF